MRTTILLILFNSGFGSIATFGQNGKTIQNLDFYTFKIKSYTDRSFISFSNENTNSKATCNLSANLINDALDFHTWERPLETGGCCSVFGNVTYHVFDPFQVDQYGLNIFTGQQVG
ncbi:MAG: hypothetical protein H0X63_04070 [Flavobacteriales bacterium]|nr:hypothetical protein [Flavobacteriales bacterium]